MNNKDINIVSNTIIIINISNMLLIVLLIISHVSCSCYLLDIKCNSDLVILMIINYTFIIVVILF